MKTFGEVLRTFRQMSHDPDRHKRPLSQGRLGEFIGHTMQDGGYSGAAVSNWERGKNKISAEDRTVLVAIIKVLYECGGIQTREDADHLLDAGNYRALNKEEIQEIFGEMPDVPDVVQPIPEPKIRKSFPSLLLENLFSLSEGEAGHLLRQAEQGPPPSWPRVLVALLKRASEGISVSLKMVLWIWVGLLAWWLIAPSLRWPFVDLDAALRAMMMYVAGTLVIPLLIGLLVDTKNNEYWQEQGLAGFARLRLYTYQGAGIGFNLSYFFVLPLVLFPYYLHLAPSFWLEVAAVTLGLILGKMAAHLAPHNLWLAYHRLHYAEGGIFFVVALLGPLWGIFFLQYYSVLLTPFLGSMLILVAFTLFVIITVLQSRKRSDANRQT